MPKQRSPNRTPQRGAAAGGRRTYFAVATVGAATLFTDVLTDVFIFTDVFTDVFPDAVTIH